MHARVRWGTPHFSSPRLRRKEASQVSPPIVAGHLAAVGLPPSGAGRFSCFWGLGIAVLPQCLNLKLAAGDQSHDCWVPSKDQESTQFLRVENCSDIWLGYSLPSPSSHFLFFPSLFFEVISTRLLPDAPVSVKLEESCRNLTLNSFGRNSC